MVRQVTTRIGAALLALGLLLAGVLVIGTSGAAYAACTCQDKTLAEHAEAASAVFSGTIRDTKKPEPDESGRIKGEVVYVVDVETVWQENGTVVTDTVRVSSPRAESACGLGDLEPGTELVFFAKARETGFRAAACGGSRPLTASFESEVETELGPGRAVVSDEERPAVELTPVDTAVPPSVTRAAAPGAALVIVGLLGLVLVRVAGSRRA